ncbi:DUF4159 domain-containing protein [Pseudohongiella spirulinae]|uniref:DUF4159 domain-containing protein n=1 Tax=Pseudohongiella spirulinae TaxID=1249552 RepID=A0A0S2KBZ9_9GAMM|nr:DUF4159 domain-containing protein [Pseudohongiella spirulinae]ALO45701.1 hypothetical protein PS2015_1036 [Pseudohongiella spirulinae]
MGQPVLFKRRVLRKLALAFVVSVLSVLAIPTMAQPDRSIAFPPDFDITTLQQRRPPPIDMGQRFSPGSAEPLAAPEFTFIRGRYENYPGGRTRRGGWWDTDFPDAERNFLRGVQRYTLIDTDTSATRAMDLTDPALFENIFLYMTMKRVPIGSMRSGPNFTPAEADSLREFMLRGGFVMVDDFWTDAHFQDFLIEMSKIFPDREVVRLDLNHEIFRMFYDVERVPQVPGRAVTWDYGSVTLDDPRYPPAVHAVLDDDGRVMLVANYNSDMGDGWEHTFLELYPTQMSNEAYRLGINYLIYAYTH